MLLTGSIRSGIELLFRSCKLPSSLPQTPSRPYSFSHSKRRRGWGLGGEERFKCCSGVRALVCRVTQHDWTVVKRNLFVSFSPGFSPLAAKKIVYDNIRYLRTSYLFLFWISKLLIAMHYIIIIKSASSAKISHLSDLENRDIWKSLKVNKVFEIKKTISEI